VATGEDNIGPRKSRLGAFRQNNAPSVVSNIGDEFFGKSSLTGQIKSDLLSKSAAVDICVT
jgi:hypothetical protein